MEIALIAHDQKKNEMVNFMIAYEQIFAHHKLYSTGTTGKRIMEATNLQINRLMSGPLGGDQQIGALVAEGILDLIIFFRDPQSRIVAMSFCEPRSCIGRLSS